MVSQESIAEQLKRIGFKSTGWGRSEVSQLPEIILPDEQIFECVNGFYEAGFALLVATDVRVLLIDKKPFNYLTVEDLRFDMINEIDYSHRVLGASVSIATGSKNLRFRSYNQPRLRKLISHVQHCMAEGKKQESSHLADQKQHLEQINKRLQKYLQAQPLGIQPNSGAAAPARMDPELSDILFAQSLMAQYNQQNPSPSPGIVEMNTGRQAVQSALPGMYHDAMKEIFGGIPAAPAATTAPAVPGHHLNPHGLFEITINPLKLAYAKLPDALHLRRLAHPTIQVTPPDKEPMIQPG